MRYGWKTKIVLWCVALVAHQGLWAQVPLAQGGLRGTVLDRQSQQPLAGAALRLLGTDAGVVADAQGFWEMQNLPAGLQKLVVSYLGYQPDTLALEVNAGKVRNVEAGLQEVRLEIAGLQIEAGKPQGLALVNRIDMQLRPVNSAQELLRVVPGVFIAQHAGGGKAEQIFLRGFDIDHGTDLALKADGMPVNMVSHAHGQGYADLHFLIPETVERLAIDKGPYAAQNGNLATAGAIDFQTRSALDENLVKVEGGMYNNYRALAMLKLDGPHATSHAANTWMAGEYTYNQGYFQAPQNLHRINLFVKYRKLLTSRSLLTATLSDFRSQWNASGQIPERAVAQGLISRWGSIDPTEGGHTSRSNLNLQLSSQLGQGWALKQQLYACRYTFDLYSNFTFWANDSTNGDQIRQHEKRWLSGYQATMSKAMTLAGRPLTPEVGVGMRMDHVGEIGLDHTQQRRYLGSVQQGAVQEQNAFAWLGAQWMLSSKLQLGGTLRTDYLHFGYVNALEVNAQPRQAEQAIVSPKATADYFVSDRLQLFCKAGSGFHSNDTRVVLGADGRRILPRALGTDLGAIFKPADRLLLQVALWGLAMQQEFVYVGDEGIVEPSGRSRRAGMDLSARWQLLPWLAADADLNLAHARGLDDAGARTYIPLAPWVTSTGGLTLELRSGLRASLRYRLLGNRPATDDGSLIAQGYGLVDGAVSYVFKTRYTIGLSGQNLLDAKWKEAQFATTSRLQGEAAPVTEIHYTPGTPLALKLSLACKF